MSAVPTQAQCFSMLANGMLLTVTATRRARNGRADVKCYGGRGHSVGGVGGVDDIDGNRIDLALGERMRQVVRLARHTEARIDSRDQVVISVDVAPQRHERDWELAVVLADRMVRGVWQPVGPVHANGWSDQWQLGRVDGHAMVNDAPSAIHGGPGGHGALAHLGALAGRPDSAPSVSSARAWFPLHSGGVNDALSWVEVSVYPLAQPAGDEEDSIAVTGLDASGQLAVRQALAGARHFDVRGSGRWRSLVRFGQALFQGNSYELALVMADRLARGREFVPRGRVIASGCSLAWHAGRVDSVDGCAPKCALILRQAVAGDRILLPRLWEAQLPAGFVTALRERGASVACIDAIGII